MNGNNAVDKVTRQWAAWPRNRGSISGIGNVFCLVQKAQTGSRAHLDSDAMNVGALLRRQSGRGLKLAIRVVPYGGLGCVKAYLLSALRLHVTHTHTHTHTQTIYTKYTDNSKLSHNILVSILLPVLEVTLFVM